MPDWYGEKGSRRKNKGEAPDDSLGIDANPNPGIGEDLTKSGGNRTLAPVVSAPVIHALRCRRHPLPLGAGCFLATRASSSPHEGASPVPLDAIWYIKYKKK